MKDEALEFVRKNRKAISRRCDYDARKLVKYYQERKKAAPDQTQGSSKPGPSRNGVRP